MQNKPKTVALVANTSWNIHNFRLNLIKVLEENGYQVVVIAPTDKYISYREKFPKVKHYGLRQLNRKSLNPIREIKLVKEMVNVYKKADADVYIQYTIKPNIFGSIAARLADKKCISIITGLGYTFINNGYINKIAKILYRIALKNNSRVIFENQEDRLLFLRSKLTEDKKAVSIKGCGVDTEYFSPMPKKRTSDELVFTFIGRLLIDKGVKEFVEAAKLIVAKHKNIRFWVVGEIDADNPAMIKKQDLVAWTDSKVIEYKGFYDDVRQVIRDSDCIVLPSYREAIPRVIQEGMSMGKPAITTNVPGCREAVQHGENGFLVNVKDADDLAEKMLKIAEMTNGEREIMGQKGLEKVHAEFDERIIANQILKLIEKSIY